MKWPFKRISCEIGPEIEKTAKKMRKNYCAGCRNAGGVAVEFSCFFEICFLELRFLIIETKVF